MTVLPVIPEAPAQIPLRSSSSQNSDDKSNDFHSYLRSSSRDDTEETNDSVHERPSKPQKREKQTNKADKDETTGANAAPVQSQTNQPAPPPLSIAALLGLPTVQKTDTVETGKVTKDDGTAVLSLKNAQPGGDKSQSKTGAGAPVDPAALLNTIAPQLLNIADQTDNSKVDPANTASNAIGSEVKGNNAALLTAGASPGNTPTAAQAPGNLAFALRLSEGELSSKPKQTSPQTGSAEPTTGVVPSSSNTDLAAVVEAAAGSQLKEQSHQHDEGTGAAFYEISRTQPQNIADKPQLTSEQPVQTSAADLEAKQEAATLEPVRNVHMQVIGDNNSRVDVRLIDRGGELHVSVKSGDVNLAQNLQDHMPELTSRLDQQRFQSEVWMPKLGDNAKPEMSGTRDFTSGGNNNSNNSNTSDRQGKGQQQYKPDWVDVLENSTRGTGRIDQTWHQ